MHSARGARVACAGLCWLSAAGLAWAQPQDAAVPTGKWLVDLARDYALTNRGNATVADLAYLDALLRGSVRLAPDEPEAYENLYELAQLRGDPNAAAPLLDRLIKLTPDHAGVASRWIEMHLAAVQTLEQREDWLKAEVVNVSSRSDYARALGCVALASIAAERFEPNQARNWLERANQLYPTCPEAVRLAYALSADEPPPRRLAAALDLLELNPLDADAAWTAGGVLQQAGLPTEAAAFLEHAVRVEQRTGAPGPAAIDHRLELADNYVARGQWPVAADALREIVRAAPDRTEAAFALHWVLMHQQARLEADGLRAALAARFAAITDPNKYAVSDVAHAAWFYCRLDPDPNRALAFANAAAARAPLDPYVVRVRGWAQALNGDAGAAIETLRPIAGTDPYAAYQLAKLLRAAGDGAGAAAVLDPWRQHTLTGPAAELLAELTGATSAPTSEPALAPAPQPTSATAPAMTPAEAAAAEPTTRPTGSTTRPTGAATRPTAAEAEELRAALAQFDPHALDFVADPSRFLEVRIRFARPSMSAGHPWWAEFAIANRGPVPLALGPDWAISPVFLLSFEAKGDQPRTWPNLMVITLDSRRLLRPGETVRLWRTIDLGPLRRTATLTPQQLQVFTLTGVFDPVWVTQDGQTRPVPGPAGHVLSPVTFTRMPLMPSPEALAALFSDLGGTAGAPRWAAVDVLAQLLGEQQRAGLQALSYKPDPIPTGRVHDALVSALGSSSWELRARTLGALDAAGLDAPLIAAVQQNLTNDQWLVRLMAVRVLVRQGAAFQPTAEKLAASDPDECVREVARSYLERWRAAAAPTSQPTPAATAPTSAPAQ